MFKNMIIIQMAIATSAALLTSAHSKVTKEIAGICSGLTETTASSANAKVTYKDHKISVDGNNTLTISKSGVLIEKISDYSFDKYVECLEKLSVLDDGS